MEPKEEIYLLIRDRISEISDIEYVDFNRGQYAPGKETYPAYDIACLIGIANIQWQTMTEQLQEGVATVEVTLYTRDGFAATHFGTENENDSLAALTLANQIAEKLQLLKGNLFKPLEQIKEENLEININAIAAYKLTFTTLIYRKTTSRYSTIENPLKQHQAL